MRETLSSSSSSTIVETKRVSQMLSAAITHRTEHMASADCNPREQQRERHIERDSKGAQEWPQQLRSTKRAQRQRERSCFALLSCFTVPCALSCACCLTRTQQLHSFPPNFKHLPDCSHTGSAARALSLTGRQEQVAGACGFSSKQELRIIIRNFNSNSVLSGIRFDFIAKISEFVFCKIKFAVHCLHIDRTTLLPISSSFPLTQILSKLSIVQSTHTHIYKCIHII